VFGPIFLSAADAADMRAQQAETIAELGSIGQIKRPTYIPNGYGGTTVTFEIQENVPMRLWISSGPNLWYVAGVPLLGRTGERVHRCVPGCRL